MLAHYIVISLSAIGRCDRSDVGNAVIPAHGALLAAPALMLGDGDVRQVAFMSRLLDERVKIRDRNVVHRAVGIKAADCFQLCGKALGLCDVG